MNGTVIWKFVAFPSFRKFEAIFASPNRYFTENSHWVPLINGDTEEAIESVSVDWVSILLKRVEFRENVRAFFPLGQNKLSTIKRCLS